MNRQCLAVAGEWWSSMIARDALFGGRDLEWLLSNN